MTKHIETEIDINAPAERVWEIINRADAYKLWNPFLSSVTGDFVVGKRITVIVCPPGGRSIRFSPRVLKAGFPEIRWKGQLLMPGVFDGEHYLRLEQKGEQTTRFVHGEHFSGVLVGLFPKTLEKTRAGFESMNAALKKSAEGRKG